MDIQEIIKGLLHNALIEVIAKHIVEEAGEEATIENLPKLIECGLDRLRKIGYNISI